LKAIGIFVLLLLIALGVGTVLLTREPSRELDAQGRTWVSEFATWHDEISRPLGNAVATTGGLGEEGLSARQVKHLGPCARSLARLGPPPGFLHSVAEDASAACGQIGVALSVDAKYSGAGRATTWDHLRRAESLLAVAKADLPKLNGAHS